MRIGEFIYSLPRRGLAGVVTLYQLFISPLKPRCCRFEPTCSQYAKEALLRHGAIKGTMLALWRIMRCHPFYHGSLYDPVPPVNKKKD